MRGLASFIMRGRFQAVLVMVLAAILPVLNIFSGAALALVTLRKGSQEGMLNLLIATCLLIILAVLLFGSTWLAIGLLGTFWLPLWLLSGVLRHTIALAVTLQLALLLALLALLGGILAIDDSAAWGRPLLEHLLEPLLQQLQLSDLQRNAIEAMLAPFSLGLFIANGLLSVLLSLLLGRWWQSLLFNPGGFGAEFRELRLGRQLALPAALVFAGVLLWQWPLLANLIPLLLVIYTLQGTALAHAIIRRARLARGWLVGFYLLLLLLPQILVLVCLLSIVDAWADFRVRIKSPAGTA
jgi:hypothetical protein